MHLKYQRVQIVDNETLVVLTRWFIRKVTRLKLIMPFVFLSFFVHFSLASSKQIFTVNEGLTLNEVGGIYQDKYMKYIWIYTQNGLNRYNGHNIKKLYIERDTLKANDFINDITEDDNHNIWIATNKGLARYNYISNSWVSLPQKLQHGKYKHVRYLGDDLLYGVRNDSLIEINLSSKVIALKKVPTPAKSIRDIVCLNKRLIIGSSSGIFAYNAVEDELQKIITDIAYCNQVKFIEQDSSLWIKKKNSCYIIPIVNGQTEVSKMKDYHHLILKQTGVDYKIGDIAYADNKYWFATQDGLISIDKTTDELEQKEDLNYWMNSLLFDNKGNLWCGTWQKGVVKLANKKSIFKSFMPSELISGILELDSNRIGLATETKGLVVFNRAAENFQEIYNASNTTGGSDFLVAHKIMHSIKRDELGRVWGGYYNKGFNVIAGRDKNRINEAIKSYILKHDNLTCNDFYFDTKNNRVFIASSEGVLLFDTKTLKVSNFIQDKMVSAVFKDAVDNLWVGTKSGLMIYNIQSGADNQSLEEKAKAAGVLSEGITCFYTDSINNIWIGTYGDGLYHYKIKEQVFERIQQAMYIDFKIVYSITEDNYGKLWLGTNSGLVEFDSSNNRFSRYSKFDGIQDNQFNYNSVTKASDGTIFMGGINGFTYFKPLKVKEKIEIPKPIISDIIVGDEKVKHVNTEGSIYPSSIDVPFAKNSFDIAFFTPDYTAPENYIYKYSLEGYSANERLSTPNAQSVFFSDVPPGKYVLKLWVTLPNSEWSAVCIGPEIRVLPPWYKTTVAYCTYLIILLALFYITYLVSRRQTLYKSKVELAKLEKKQAEEINQSKLRFFTDVAHEIRTPLTLILGPIKDILLHRRLEKDLQISLTQVHKSALNLKNLMDELLLFRKAENGTLPLKLQENNIAELIENTCEAYRYEFSAKNIHLQYPSEVNIVAVYDSEKLAKVLSNLLSNAIKHTPIGGSIVMDMNTIDKGFNFFVKDTGAGVSKNEISTIFNRFYQSAENKEQGFGIGLALAKKIIEAHEGQLKVESVQGKGSTFSVFIPHLQANSQPKIKPETHTEKEETIQHIENTTHKKTIKGNILIVEDNIEISTYISKIFEPEYNVTVKVNGKAGLEYAISNIPDIIVTDNQMPQMDGVTMCKKLKAEFITSHIPVILLSAYNEVEEQLKGLESGANDYIGKPFHSDILLQKIGNIIQSRKQLIVSFKEGENVDLSNFELQDQRFLDKLNKIIADEMKNETFGVPVLCEKLALSKTTLNDKLRRMLDVSTAEYIKKTRLKEAYRLLTKENYSSSDAAYAVGFSPAYFTVCFKKEYGVPPGKI